MVAVKKCQFGTFFDMRYYIIYLIVIIKWKTVKGVILSMSQKKKIRGPLKRVATIHDLSGFGKCSMTVALPILSAAGVEACCMPTAILSTHTGGFNHFTYHDLTGDLIPFMDHWKSLNLHFDAIYSGFLGSSKQAEMLIRFIDLFKEAQTLVCVDPAMADDGELYSVFDREMVLQMKKLCSKADLLMPNITEASFLLDRTFRKGPYNRQEVIQILKDLSGLGPSQIVLTGVYFDDERLGAACYDKKTEQIHFAFSTYVHQQFHGTGDVFGSFLVAAMMNNFVLQDAIVFAVELTQQAIERTIERQTLLKDGVDFEGVIPEMIHKLGLSS